MGILRLSMKKKINIQLASHEACTGCKACASVCPTNSIAMCENQKGFLQPHIDADTCIGCHKCENTCPIISKNENKCADIKVYAAVIKDEVFLQRSSSGGMFYALAKWTIEQDGVVFGAAFDGIHLKQQYAETLQGIDPFMGSKYVQSDTADSFRKVKSFLDENRWVLYSGTPCQIAGLKKYLHKDYDKLVTVDLICHGVPSASVWEKYISRLMQKIGAKDIKSIRFRTKDWSVGNEKDTLNYYLSLSFLKAEGEWKQYKKYWNEDPYFKFFMRHIFRPSCYQCTFRNIAASYADFTIGDCWNAGKDHPRMPIEKGISTIICHTEKAKIVFGRIKQTMIVEEEPLSVMLNRYAEDKQNTKIEAKKRMWRTSNYLAQYIPLENLQWLYMHDRIDYIIRRKFQKIWKRNTK